MSRARSIILLAVVLIAGGAVYYWRTRSAEPEGTPNPGLSFERLTNTFFTPEPRDPLVAPEVRLVRMPAIPGDMAVWGATGRDDEGHIWIGVSLMGAATVPGQEPSARLVEYDPTADLAIDRGGVLENLGRLGMLKPGEAQVKIHSKIVQAGDGNLYFASMNDVHEEGGPRAPPFGSHLWRLRLPERQWEHLLAAPEGLIAVAGGGDYIYALGYPDHRLVQYHVPTGKARWTTVGSFGGHISRNLIADSRGHVYVPRLKAGPAESPATLVEYDTNLGEIGSTPLQHYMSDSPDAAHGIVAFQHMADRSIYFATDVGRLYRIQTDIGSGPAIVTDAGWFHRDGATYTPSMFTFSGKDTLVGLGRRDKGGGVNAWLVRDLQLGMTFATRFKLPQPRGKPMQGVILYGCQTRDRYGDFYVVGSYRDGHSLPLVLRVRPPDAANDKKATQP